MKAAIRIVAALAGLASIAIPVVFQDGWAPVVVGAFGCATGVAIAAFWNESFF